MDAKDACVFQAVPHHQGTPVADTFSLVERTVTHVDGWPRQGTINRVTGDALAVHVLAGFGDAVDIHLNIPDAARLACRQRDEMPVVVVDVGNRRGVKADAVQLS